MDKEVKECRSAPLFAPKIWRGAPRSCSKFAGVTERRSSSWSGYPSLLVSWNKDRRRAPPSPEEERIDDDLDFEPAKFSNTLRSSCRRPVTERDKEGEHQRRSLDGRGRSCRSDRRPPVRRTEAALRQAVRRTGRHRAPSGPPSRSCSLDLQLTFVFRMCTHCWTSDQSEAH